MIGIVGLLGAVGALIIAGCSEDKKEQGPERGRNRKTSREDPSQPRSYRPSCFGDSSCPEPEQVAAVHDLAGALYGERGMVTFDRVLTPEERHHVQASFGLLTNPYGSTDYLRRARERFLRREQILPSAVGMGRMEQSELPFFKGGFYLVGDPFYCDPPTPCDGIFFSIAQDPSRWRLVIDHFALLEFMPDSLNETFSRIASVLNVPTIDPFPPPWDEKILGELRETYEITPVESAVRFAFMALSDLAARAPDKNINAFDPPADFMERISRYFNIPPDVLRTSYGEFMGERQDPSRLDLSVHNRRARQWLRRYLYTAVPQTAQRIVYFFDEWRRPRTLFVLRQESLAVFREMENAYADLDSQTPF